MRKQRLYIYKLFLGKPKSFPILVSILFLISSLIHPYPSLAAWFGFMIAGYSAIANDSIQTIGTFISSSQNKKWWVLWLFIGILFLATVLYSWVTYHGDVSFQRLATKGFTKAPESFSFLQLCAPIVLLVLTRFKIPVSTTFLLLSIFSTSASGLYSILEKSLKGYLVAFFCSFVIWVFLEKLFKRLYKGNASLLWTVFQWITSGTLWCVWIIQDAANIAVFLPRSLSLAEFIFFSTFIFFGLGILFYYRGDKIQEIINQKSNTVDIRSATLIDLVYAIIMIAFTKVNPIPMSTTWVFIGLLGGRELGIDIANRFELDSKTTHRNTLDTIVKDILRAAFGLFISICLAVLANKSFANELNNLFFLTR